MSASSYYWRGVPNFGDWLGPLLLKHFSDIDVTWASPVDADIVSVGSVIDVLKPEFAGIIAGSGKLHEKTPVNFPNAKIFGLRGPLTARGVKGDFTLGDPGLLADELVPRPNKTHNLGLVPHWSDDTLIYRKEFLKYEPLIINPRDEPLKVLSQIGSCRKIVASSLHGIIVADAFGIPRRTETTPRFLKEGGAYKFLDHAAAVGLPFELGVTQAAPRHTVTDLQHSLFDMLEDLGTYVRKNLQ
jgi:pyruvyltransferase